MGVKSRLGDNDGIASSVVKHVDSSRAGGVATVGIAGKVQSFFVGIVFLLYVKPVGPANQFVFPFVAFGQDGPVFTSFRLCINTYSSPFSRVGSVVTAVWY